MILQQLLLKGFRNYSSLHTEFHPTLNMFIADNGRGKTNLIEAIYMLGLTKSFRSSKDTEVTHIKNDSYYIKGSGVLAGMRKEQYDSSFVLELAYQKENQRSNLLEKKQGKWNGSVFKKLKEMIGILTPIVFQVSDIDWILGPPNLRRRLFDITLSMVSKSYLTVLQEYHYLLKQRNAALRLNQPTFRLYDLPLASKGSQIMYSRMVVLTYLDEHLLATIRSLNPELAGITWNFLSSIPYTMDHVPSYKAISVEEIGAFIEENHPAIASMKKDGVDLFEAQAQKDIRLKQTTAGIHRDDWSIKNEGQAFKRFASQGQIRVVVLALQLCLNQFIEHYTQDPSIFLVDDVFMDLDDDKRNRCFDQMKNNQIFYTSTSTHGLKEEHKQTGFLYHWDETIRGWNMRT